MLQRWTKTVAFLALTAVLFTACRKSEFSPDNPLPETFSPLVFTTSQNNFLYALDPTTGVKRWELRLPPQGLQASPVVVGDFLYLAMDSLYKVDAKRGKMVKVYSFPNVEFDSFYSTPLVDGNTLYLGSYKQRLFALNLANETLTWNVGTKGSVLASPVMYQQLVIVGTSEGEMHAVDKGTGAPNWQKSVAFSAIAASPAIGNYVSGKASVYATSLDGKLYALDATTGTAQWNFTSGAPIWSSPIAYGGTVVFGSSDYFVYCVDTQGKRERWKYKTGDRVLSSPFGDNNVIYVGSYDYHMYALNIIDGTEKWKFKSNALIKASPLVHEGTVYFGSFDKNLYGVDTSGKLKWSHNTNGLIESSPVLWDLTRGFYPSTSGNSVF